MEFVVVAGYVAFANLIAFLAFGWDKFCATQHMRRVSEAELLGLAIGGGAAGAIAAQQIFRHKTQKQPFKSQLYLAAAFNVIAAASATVWFVASTS